MTTPFLVADCVSKAFGARRILTAASLRAQPGEVRALLGRNGIGKSTLLKIAAGLLRADTGTIHLAGTFLEYPTLAYLGRAGVFYLPDHDLLSHSLTLRQQLHLMARRFGERTALEAARAAKLEDHLDAYPSTLSGGELRRAELALAFARRPRCLLADEPLRGIAPIDHEAIGLLLREMAGDGCAVVVTGHEVPTLLTLADHVTWCTAGTTHEVGAPAQAMAHEGFRRDYAGTAPRSAE